MANMGYCRFRNTESDLLNCVQALQCGDLETHDSDGITAEMKAAQRMKKLCERYIAEFDNHYNHVQEN